MKIKLVFRGFTLHVCSVYAPQMGVKEEVKARFWEDLDEVVRSVPSAEKIVIAGDFNGHIGILPGGYDDVYGGFGFGVRNGKGAAVLDFARAFELVVVNLSFPKKEDHLITFRSTKAKTQIDFLLLRKGDRVLCKKSRDLAQVKCIKGEDSSVLVENAHIKKSWQDYFHRLLNEEGNRGIELGKLEHSEKSRDFSYCRRFKVEEVKEAICNMQRGRVTGPDEISVDFWKYARGAGLGWLTDLFNSIFKTARMPEAWR
ncbi:craniofacial development protein 2-like [Capsicum annuum]|uniref:craniofacial development protein 2-like n=1 Tax=Capsicum annuum TaxID=4072 RepID=UPI001FB0CE5E|nr:craniofacial development protein 2-like [Capsicum annuum]